MPDRIRLYMQFMQRIWRRQKLVLTLGGEKTQFLILLLLVQKHLITMFSVLLNIMKKWIFDFLIRFERNKKINECCSTLYGGGGGGGWESCV
jgi:hypothetical protein